MKNKNQLAIGLHPVLQALESGKEINKIFLKKGLRGEQVAYILRKIKQENIPFQYVPVEKLNRLSRSNHQGVIASFSLIEYENLEEIVQRVFEQGRDPFIMILDRITDVRNFGAIVRTGECAGVDAIVIASKGSVSITEDAIKTSSGALTRVAICRSPDLSDSVKTLKKSGLYIVAATEKANQFHYNTDLQGPVALILGSEENGISRSVLEEANELVKIPVKGKVESLNVGVACGIIAYEIIRQRDFFD